MKNVDSLALIQEDKMGRGTVCWQCGKQKPVNVSGVCEDCWIKYAYLREK